VSSVKHLVIARPSGNVTAIVFDEDVARDDMREIGAGVQRDNPDVEQVLFVQKHGDMIHGQMAGGEFCGNAARALGYVLADGEEGSQTFTMSGLSQPVTVDVKADYAKLKIRTSLEHQQIDLGNAPVPIVHLEGISHAILLPEHPLFHLLKKYASRADRWKTVMNVLDDLNLNDRPACGLIFVDGVNSSISITPYVYVRNIETLYAETACASGSIAVTALLGKNLSVKVMAAN